MSAPERAGPDSPSISRPWGLRKKALTDGSMAILMCAPRLGDGAASCMRLLPGNTLDPPLPRSLAPACRVSCRCLPSQAEKDKTARRGMDILPGRRDSGRPAASSHGSPAPCLRPCRPTSACAACRPSPRWCRPACACSIASTRTVAHTTSSSCGCRPACTATTCATTATTIRCSRATAWPALRRWCRCARASPASPRRTARCTRASCDATGSATWSRYWRMRSSVRWRPCRYCATPA